MRNKAAEKAKHVHQHHHQIPQGHNTSESLDSSTGASSEQGQTAIKSNTNLATSVITHTPTGGTSSTSVQELGASTDNPTNNNEGNGNNLTSSMQLTAEQRSPTSGPGSGTGIGPGPGPVPSPSVGSGSGYSINGILGLQQSHHLQNSSNNNNSISTNNNTSSETSKRKRIEIHGKHHIYSARVVLLLMVINR